MCVCTSFTVLRDKIAGWETDDCMTRLIPLFYHVCTNHLVISLIDSFLV